MTRTTTYCPVCHREANVLLELLCRVTGFEYESQSVAWRKDCVFVWVIRGIYLATNLLQELLIIENLKNVKSKKDIIIDQDRD